MNHQEDGTEPTQPRQGLNYRRRRTGSNDRPLEPHRLRVVVALGGNALDGKARQGVYAAQVRNALAASRQILEIVKAGHQVVLTHGNGPQVGNLALQQELSAADVPPQPLHVLDSMTQGQIGYLLQREIGNALKGCSIARPVVSVVTQVVVDAKDGAFGDPTKPIGPFYDQGTAKRLAKERGYVIRRVKPRGARAFRRVVPSPEPIGIVEAGAISTLVRSGAIVVASGGGGVPVVPDRLGRLRGVDAVVDKDLAAEKLAEAVDADALLILTDVEKVKLSYGKSGERGIDRMTATEARRYAGEGHFPAGSMGPKVLACVRFVERGGALGVIASFRKGAEALEGRSGTRITADPTPREKGRNEPG